jgi:D-alanyl-lipoteichoic acid acyltransferase DltB (MBOAT superfamily)
MGSHKQWAPFFLFITFTLSGLWHGAAWNFIIWGAYHGALLLLLRYLGRPFHSFVGKYLPQPAIVSWALTFGSVVLGCLFFMETNSNRLFQKLQTLVNPFAYSWSNLQELFGSYNVNQGSLLIFILLLSIGVLVLEHIAVWKEKFEYELLLSRWLSPILLGMTFLFASTSSAGFIYFEF